MSFGTFFGNVVGGVADILNPNSEPAAPDPAATAAVSSAGPVGGGPPPGMTQAEWDLMILQAAHLAAGGTGPVGLGGPGAAPGVGYGTYAYTGPGGVSSGTANPYSPFAQAAMNGEVPGININPYLSGGAPSPGTGAPMLPGGGATMGVGLSGSDQLLQDLMLLSQTTGGQPNNPMHGIPYNRPAESVFESSGMPINETLLANMIYNEPQMAITLGGAAQYGTPGYYNLAGMDFDPYSVYLASGGNALAGPTDYLNFSTNMYNTMGTVGSKGGGTVNAGALLKNMVLAPSGSQLGMMFAEKPELFYQMAVDVAAAAGMAPMGQQALKLQLAGLYQEYMTTALTQDAGETLPFHTWIATAHPEAVAAWGA